MRIPVNSPWLPGYIDVAQTILIILTMDGLLPDKPRGITWKHIRYAPPQKMNQEVWNLGQKFDF